MMERGREGGKVTYITQETNKQQHVHAPIGAFSARNFIPPITYLFLNYSKVKNHIDTMDFSYVGTSPHLITAGHQLQQINRIGLLYTPFSPLSPQKGLKDCLSTTQTLFLPQWSLPCSSA